MELLNIPSMMQPVRLVWPGSWVGHIPFASWLVGVLRPSLLVELGTHTGNSYCGFCQAIVEQGVPARAFAVDTWEGDAHAGRYDSSVLEGLTQHHDPRYGAFSTLLRMTFDEALARFEDGSIDLLHIDGLHTYEAVRHDFESWLPKLSPRAVVLFHDTEVHRDDFGVFVLWDELVQRYRGFNFGHSNGLGVLLVGAQVPAPLLEVAADNDATGPWGIASRFFAALGRRFEQQAELADRAVLLGAREDEIERLRALVAHRDRDVAELRQAVDVRDEKLANAAAGETANSAQFDALLRRAARLEEQISASEVRVQVLTRERDERAACLAAMHASTSWRLTAPVRLAGLLARGRFAEARQRLKGWRSRSPSLARVLLSRMRAPLLVAASGAADEAVNRAALDTMVEERNLLTRAPVRVDPMTAAPPDAWPRIDVSVVTFNSQRWIDSFFDSVETLNYPKDRISLRFVDNGSTDETVRRLKAAFARLQRLGLTVEVVERPNLGFGAGHNAGLAGGKAEFCLVTNIDLTFVSDALSRVVATAVADAPRAVAWELRQKPYEHPKFYDPVTGTTNWNSHACVLLRRSAFDAVGGYDDNLFMYGEDVELSYRLRRQGGVLRYCPAAVVMHYSYTTAGQVKPLQYTGSTFASLYLRLKFGSMKNLLAVPLMGTALFLAPQPYPGARRAVVRSLLRLLVKAPGALLGRKSSEVAFAFRGWDYELARDGAFVEGGLLPDECPLVSVVTRTYRGRHQFLRQAILSVAHQTWPNIEHVIVEDGGETMRPIIDELAAVTGLVIRFVSIKKAGRSSAGNAGLAAAQGRWCVFLDDDDLLFADHVEALVQAVRAAPDTVAAYSPAIEVLTESLPEPEGMYRETSHAVPPSLRQPFDASVLRHHNFMAIQSVLFERRLFLERGGFELDMEALEDWVLWSVYAHHQRFAYLPKATSLFRTPAHAETRGRRNLVLVEAYQLACQRIAMRLRELTVRVVAAGLDADERDDSAEPQRVTG